MSVSEGIKKYSTKNYYVKLSSLGAEGEIADSIKGNKIQPWTKVNELKTKIGKYFGISNKNIRLFYCNIEMIDELTMLDYKVLDVKKPEIFFRISSSIVDSQITVQVYGAFYCPPVLNRIIEDIRHGFMEGLVPNLLLDGTSGTYTLRNTNKDIVALFKPIDEEAFAPNNQKGYTGKFGQESFRKGILSGEGSIREVAAFLLDKLNFFDIPETTFVEIAHPTFNTKVNELLSIEDNSFHKIRNSISHNFIHENLITSETSLKHKISSESDDNSITSSTTINSKSISKYNYVIKKYGSLQRFVKSDDVAANFSSSLFPVEEIHKIGIFDIRTLNCDRNDENILVVKKREKLSGKSYYKLIPIDHSLSFPDCIKILEYEMCWMSWDQAKQPFSEKFISYIKNLNILEDMKKLSKTIKLRNKCWKNFRIANTVLKMAVESDLGLTLYDIGMILFKPEFEEDIFSEVEILMEKTDKICSLYYNIHLDNISIIFADSKGLNDKDDEDNIFESKNHPHNSIHPSTIIIIENNQQREPNLITYIDPKMISNKLEEENFSILHKKKHSLLKRTASEPKLSIIGSTINDLSENHSNQLNNNAVQVPIKFQELSVKRRKSTLYKHSIYKPKFKSKPQFWEEEDSDMDSPYNEIYFYNFETVFQEFLVLKFKDKFKTLKMLSKINKEHGMEYK